MQIKAKKSLGQNFLRDKNVILDILEAADVKNKDVIEIGPGQGALTKLIVKEAKSLTAFEIDKDMINILKDSINTENFTLKHEDFLVSDLTNIKPETVLVANIPYYITSDILFKIFENYSKFSKAIIMMQKEVAERIIAKPNSSEYSKLSVSSQFFSSVTKLFDVSPKAFKPEPKVWSSVVCFEFKKSLEVEAQSFLTFLKICFNFRRKKLLNNLVVAFNKQEILEVYKKLNYSENIRAQELSLEQFIDLFQSFKK